jgi:hypothetical protein
VAIKPPEKKPDEPKPFVPSYEHTSAPREEANPWRTLLFYAAIGGGASSHDSDASAKSSTSGTPAAAVI